MLKGRGKTFAPKKIPLRKPGSTPAPVSTRPSVEPQSQTLAPVQQVQDDVASNNENTAIHIVTAVVNDAVANPQDAPPTLAKSNAPTTSEATTTTGGNQLKRKERGDGASEPVAKRQATESENTQVSAPQVESATAPNVTLLSVSQALSNRPVALSASPSSQPAVPSSNTKKEVERATLPSDPTAKLPSPSPTPSSSAQVSARPLSHDISGHGTQSTSAIHQSAVTTISGASRNSTHVVSLPTNISNENSLERSPSPDAPANPHHRYPSPENMVRLIDDVSTRSLGVGGGANDRIGAVGSGLSGPSDVVAAASLNPDGTSGGIIEEPVPGTERRQQNRRVQPADDVDDVRATVTMELNRARRATGAKRARRQRDGNVERRRRVRAVTPEGASDEEIDPTVMKMGDLTKDLKIGKKFSKYAEIKEMEELKKREALKAKMLRQNPELASLIGGNAGPAPDPSSPTGQQAAGLRVGSVAAEGAPPAANRNEHTPEPTGIVSGPRMRLLNGRMVLDESSLTIDRHANAELEREGMEIVEENDFTRKITQGTYMKREPSQSWDAAANQLFYKGLRQFGTDFGMIASMFPHRNRRQIKLKFNKEEKVNAAKINRILTNPKEPIDLDQFEKMSNIKLQSVEAIEAERAKFDAEQREEIAKFTEAAAEATRKKKESIKGSDAARKILANQSDDEDENEDGVGGSNKENAGKGKRKKALMKGKRGRGRQSDDPGEIVGTIE
jgi:transcription factor TFIIIB component B''